MDSGDIRIGLESRDVPMANVQVHRLSGKEAIHRLFSFEVDIVCLDPDDLAIPALAGASVDIVFTRESTGEELRRVHTVVNEVEDAFESEGDGRAFRLWLGPRAARLSLIETQEIYLDLSIPEIVWEKLTRAGFGPGDVVFRLQGGYPKLEFVVQYKETDLAFISRITEHVGISFSFEHVDGRDVIVFTDQNSGFPILDPAPYHARGERRDVFALRGRRRLSPKQYAVQDYNYRTPQIVHLAGSVTAPFGYGGGVVEYGSHAKSPQEAEVLARIRAEERWCADDYLTGQSDVCAFSAGKRVMIEGHPQLGDVPALLVEVEHRATQAVSTHGGQTADAGYENTFRAVAADHTFRPPRVTPRPRIHGVVSGLVVDQTGHLTGELAKVDEHGRYTVRFLFDTTLTADEEKASRPVRMAQPHAGPGYGMHFPLKPGIEVLLVFIDGDPDRPIIVGSVPNHITPSPVTSANASLHRIKTASGILIELDDASP